jgi:FlaA1/EpsC-like NDP-sugar epimerase
MQTTPISLVDRLSLKLSRAAVEAFRALADRPRAQRRQMTIALDAALCVLAAPIALYLRTGDPLWMGSALPILMGFGLVVWFPLAWARRTYSTLTRSSGGRTFVSLLSTAIIYTVPFVFVFMVVRVPYVPRTMGLLQPLIFFAMLAISRLGIRFAMNDLHGRTNTATARRRVAIYGAGRAGQQLANALAHEPQMELIAYFDDDQRLDGQVLNGVPIVVPRDLGTDLAAMSLDEVLLAIPSSPRARQREIAEGLALSQVTVRLLPSVGKIIQGEVSVSDLRAVEVEELLGRDAVPPVPELIGRNIAGQVVMVTGAGGSIGSELCRQALANNPARLVLVEQGEFALYAIEGELAALAGGCEIVPELCDVADARSIGRVMAAHSPDTVFHAAAYKHVPLVEANPVSGIRNNVFGTLHTVEAAEAAGVSRFIMVSTDKAVRPTNVMGASKRVGELILQARAAAGLSPTVLSMVRFGNVLGSSGSVVPLFRRQIEAGGPITLTDMRVTRYFMTIPEAAQLVIQAGAMAEGGEVFVLEMGSPIRILDLATTMVRLSGLTVADDDNPSGDIRITEVGLRPGEKIFEELLLGNDPRPTSHERIIKAHEAYFQWPELAIRLDEMRAALEAGDAPRALDLLELLVAGYTAPKHANGAAAAIASGA